MQIHALDLQARVKLLKRLRRLARSFLLEWRRAAVTCKPGPD